MVGPTTISIQILLTSTGVESGKMMKREYMERDINGQTGPFQAETLEHGL